MPALLGQMTLYWSKKVTVTVMVVIMIVIVIVIVLVDGRGILV